MERYNLPACNNAGTFQCDDQLFDVSHFDVIHFNVVIGSMRDHLGQLVGWRLDMANAMAMRKFDDVRAQAAAW